MKQKPDFEKMRLELFDSMKRLKAILPEPEEPKKNKEK